uniref:Movement protein TGBp3 n=1 Tax=Potexvirus alternantherae TaxID=85454 RepID=A0A125SVE5_9VIRU|nr:triple gene block protein3 [Alternanthera mosaic virus]
MPYHVEVAVAILAFIGALVVLRPQPRGCLVSLTGHSATISGDCESISPETIKALGEYLTGLRF